MDIKYTYVSIKKRLVAFILLVIFFLTALIGRLLYLQVINSDGISSRAYKQWLRDLPMTASRGSILDRNGATLASSYTTYDIYVRHADVSDERAVTQVIVNATGEEFDKVFEKVSKRGYSEVLICKAQEKEVVQNILENYQSGIFFVENTSRHYEYGNLLTHKP